MKHLLFFFVGILSLSQAANLVRAAEAHPFVVGYWRLLAAALIMAALRAWNARKKKESFWQPMPKKIAASTVLSGVFFFLHLWTFFVAAQGTSIANAMVIFSINPIFTAIGAKLFLQDPFERRHGYAFILAFCGVAILFSDRLGVTAGQTGDVAALISAVFFSLYLLTGKKSRLHIDTEQFTWVIYLITALLFFTAGEISDITWTGYPLKTWLAIAGTVIFPTLLGHVLITHLLKYFNINWLSCGKLFEPIFSAAVAYFAYNEALSGRTSIAFMCTATSVIVLIYPYLKKTSTASTSIELGEK